MIHLCTNHHHHHYNNSFRFINKKNRLGNYNYNCCCDTTILKFGQKQHQHQQPLLLSFLYFLSLLSLFADPSFFGCFMNHSIRFFVLRPRQQHQQQQQQQTNIIYYVNGYTIPPRQYTTTINNNNNNNNNNKLLKQIYSKTITTTSQRIASYPSSKVFLLSTSSTSFVSIQPLQRVTKTSCLKQNTFNTLFSVKPKKQHWISHRHQPSSITELTRTTSFTTTRSLSTTSLFGSSRSSTNIDHENISTRTDYINTMNQDSNDQQQESTTADNNNNSGIGRVIVIGSVNYDVTVYTSQLPQLGETVLGTDFTTACGGKGGNQVIAASSIATSLHSTTTTSTKGPIVDTYLICRIGSDLFGDNLIQNFQNRFVNLNVSSCRVTNHEVVVSTLSTTAAPTDNSANDVVPSGVASIIVDTKTGDNCIIVAPGANQYLSSQHVQKELNNILFSNTTTPRDGGGTTSASMKQPPTVILAQLEIPYRTVVDTFRFCKEEYVYEKTITTNQCPIITILNPAPAVVIQNVEQMNELFPYVDILVPNETELQTLYDLYHCTTSNDTTTTSKNQIENDDKQQQQVEENEKEIEMARTILHHGRIRHAVIVTLGSRGVMIVTRNKTYTAQGAAPSSVTTTKTIESNNKDDVLIQYSNQPSTLPCIHEPIIDTIGAGDGFCGALASYIAATAAAAIKGTGTSSSSSNILADMDLQYVCELACGYASMSIRRKGASYPYPKEIPDVLRDLKVEQSSNKLKNKEIIPLQQEHQLQDSNNNNESLESTVPHSDAVQSNPSSRPMLTFVTGNKNKLLEVQRILSAANTESETTSDTSRTTNNHLEFPYTLTNQKVDLPELQGHDTTEIAIEKCRLAYKVVQGPCFVEDTSLCFNALNGMPGPYIKWFLSSIGHDGLNRILNDYPDKSAYALTVIAYTTGERKKNTSPNNIADDDNDDENLIVHTFVGRTDGTIVPSRGSMDFGWDPIFQPDTIVPAVGHCKTYAEMTKDEKNKISHRGRAFEKFRQYLLLVSSSSSKEEIV